MSVPFEAPERTAMRKSLRSLERHITGLEPEHQIQLFPSEIGQVQFLPMVLDESSKEKPTYFSPFPASFFVDPDDEFDMEEDLRYQAFDSLPENDRAPFDCARFIDNYFSSYASAYFYSHQPKGGELVWSPIRTHNTVYGDLYRHKYPEFGATDVEEVHEGPFAHTKISICNNLNADDDYLLQGELLPILRLMIAHLRRARFIDHMVAPVMAFSFVGPQHARVIEAYMVDHTVVVRPTKLYDLRTKDVAAFKTFAQWYFGKPRAPTGSSQ